MKRRTALLSLSSASFLALPGLSFAQVQDLNDAINKSGQLRMLSQRLAKCYLAQIAGLRREQVDKALGDSMALFDRNLVELKAFAPKAEGAINFQALEPAWNAYKTALVGAVPSKEGADGVITSANQLLSLAQQTTTQLETLSGKANGRLVGLAGRQRMLSQRMAAMTLGFSADVQTDLSFKATNTARDEFMKAHNELKAASTTTATIKSALELAEHQFSFFDASLRTLKNSKTSSHAPVDVFTTSERILQVMDNVTVMYTRLSAA